MNAYDKAKDVFDLRRKGFLHRRISSIYCVSDRLKNGTLTLESNYNYTGNKSVVNPSEPFAIINPDGSFLLLPEKTSGRSAYRALEWLTDRRLILINNTSVKTKATGIIIHGIVWLRGKGWVFADGDEKPIKGNYYETLQEARTAGFPFMTGVTVRPPYTVLNCVSLEPVLTRKWDPEKRKIYRDLHRLLKNQSELRIRMGAFSDVDVDNAHRARQKLRAELGKKAEDGTQLEAYKAIVTAAVPFLPWDKRRQLWNNAAGNFRAIDPDVLVDAVLRFLEASREDLRLNTGAVIYS